MYNYKQIGQLRAHDRQWVMTKHIKRKKKCID